MERQVDEIRRRTWAPFVGAALAALTAGSLVVFSLVAQRTSLDGFPALRIATPTEGTPGRPASITVQPIDGMGVGERGAASSEVADTESVAVPLALIPLVPATIPPAPVELAALADPAPSRLNASGEGQADSGTFDGRFRAEGALLASSRDGGSEDPDSHPATLSDDRHDGKHAHKARAGKSKKGNKKHKKGRGESHPSSLHRAPAATSSAKAKPSHGASAAPRPKPSRQGPPAHSNAGGNGKSHGKSKSKGHKKH